MKKNLFYVAMAAVAMTACTAEETLQEVKRGQTSPISFTVTTDVDADTRAAWGGDKGVTVQWTAGDLMSLYHGATVAENNYFANMQNAIYVAKAGSSEGGLNFSTQSMVLPGQAIMVYPCDTTFSYKTPNLNVTIAEEQNAEYVLGHIPFISEGINIAEYSGKNDDNTAGYGRNYPIRLKQIGSTMNLEPVYLNKEDIQKLVDDGEIEAITVSRIALNRPTNKFNKTLPITLGTASAEDKTRWENAEPGNAWNKKSTVDSTDAEGQQTESLSFVAEEGVNVAKFLLLPQVTYNYAPDANTPGTEPAGDATVVVDTRYGTVTVADGKGTTMWNSSMEVNAETNPKYKVSEALERTLYALSGVNGKTTSAFYGEYTGKHANRKIDVDFKDLDMTNLHIKDNKHLHDALLVWKTLGLDPVNLIIDGDKNGEFHLYMDNVRTLQSAAYAGMKLKPCTVKKEKCTKIVLHNEDGTESDEIPEIMFINANAVDVELAENSTWTWTGEGKQFGNNVKSIINSGVVNINAAAKVKDSHIAAIIPMVNEGTININSGITQWEIGLTNNGLINIAETAELRAYNAEIVNNATGLDKVVFGDSANEGVCGKIENSGVLGVTAGTTGKINNYGYIKNYEGAKTYITKNQSESASFTKAFAEDNKIGVIELTTATDNISVSNATAEGFIKYTWNKEEAADENGAYQTPSEDVKYNYLIVKENIEFLTRPREIKFIQIGGENEVVITTKKANGVDEGFTETKPAGRIGFILPVGCKANLKEGNTLYTKAAYVKGTFYVGGKFGYNSVLTTYFGGVDKDTDNIVKY